MTDSAGDVATDTTTAFIDVPGVRNFRDAGCGALRPGLLYRSGGLDQLTAAGARRLDALGVRTVVDLRSATELAVWPDQRHDLDLDYRHLSLLPDRVTSGRPWPEHQLGTYLLMAETGGPAVAGAVRAVAAGEPVLVHCAVGKDRTGLTVAVIQHLAGLAEPEITADYLRSNTGLGLDDGPVPYIDELGEEHISRPITADLLHAALGRIRELHGSIEAFVLAHGATDADLHAVRALAG